MGKDSASTVDLNTIQFRFLESSTPWFLIVSVFIVGGSPLRALVRLVISWAIIYKWRQKSITILSKYLCENFVNVPSSASMLNMAISSSSLPIKSKKEKNQIQSNKVNSWDILLGIAPFHLSYSATLPNSHLSRRNHHRCHYHRRYHDPRMVPIDSFCFRYLGKTKLNS